MKSRLTDIPMLKAVSSHIEASYFNRVRLALARLENPLRIELMNLRGLDIIIDDEMWVCVDRTMGDLPTLAWTDFDVKGRKSLHEPVPCQLRFFHNHADLICGTVLEIVARHIEERLHKLQLKHVINSDVAYLSTRS